MGSYSYDGEGKRVRKTIGTVITNYVYDASGQLALEDNSDSTANPVSGAKYFTTDYLGSTRVTADSNGVPKRYDYLPYGEELSVNGRTTALGYLAPGLRLKFTGKERDTETGLDYFGARYFSGAQARFTSPDKPFADQHAEDPQSWNLYGYVRNNPLIAVDITGHEERKVTGPTIGPLQDGSATKRIQDVALGGIKSFARQGNSVLKTMGANPTLTQAIDRFSMYDNARQKVAGDSLDLLMAADGAGTLSAAAIVRGAESVEAGNYVYRGLAEGEDASLGLTVRAPGAGNTELSHVAGKRESQWISTTKSEVIATEKYGKNGVVRIDLNKVETQVSDVSKGFPGKPRQSNYAIKDQEVLIQGRIPPEAITQIK